MRRWYAACSIVSMALVIMLVTGAASPSVKAAAGTPASFGGAIGQDPILHRLFVAQPAANKVLVFDTTAMALLGTFDVPARPAAIAVDTTRHLVYIASDVAGVITRYSARTMKRLSRIHLGGRPGGLALIYAGNVLEITDEVSGEISQLPVEPAIGQPSQVLSMGPKNPAVTMAPSSAWPGRKVEIWGQDFLPKELVQVSWGMIALVKLKADSIGTIAGTFTVPKPLSPKKPDLGPHLVVLIGQTSSRSLSGLLNVVPKPLPPKVVKPIPPKPPSPMSRRLTALFGFKVTLAAPRMLAIGPLKHLQVHVAWMYLVFVYIVVTMILLILRRARRRKPQPEPKESKKKKGSPPRRRATSPAKATA